MGNYKIEDFKIGDSVYHLSNSKLKMIVIKIHFEIKEIECRWLDDKGKSQINNFLSEELGKSSDLRGISSRIIKKNDNPLCNYNSKNKFLSKN